MSNPVIQPSFAAGEISPSLYSRIDLAKYHIGAALLENFLVDFRGGAINRPGTMIVGQAFTQQRLPVHLIPFVFSPTQQFVLEFGIGYIRFISQGAYILETASNITNITQANPGVLTYSGTDPTNGNWMYLSGIQGMTQLNGQTVVVSSVNTVANTFNLVDPFGDPINTNNYSPYTTAGTMAKVYEIASPYGVNDLSRLKYAQSGDVLTITTVGQAPQDLVRFSNTNWTITPVSFGSTVPGSVVTAITPQFAGGTTYNYSIGVVDDSGQESIPIIGATTNASPITQSAGQSILVQYSLATVAQYYKIYRTKEIINANPGLNSLYGLIGISPAGTLAFVDTVGTPDFTDTPAVVNNPFTNNHPNCTTYFQQRQAYAGSVTASETFYLSQPGGRTNFNTSIPVRDTDAITGTLSSNQVNGIEFMVPTASGLIMFTTGSAFLVNGGGGSVGAPTPITPTNAAAQPQIFNGINSNVQPLVINSEIIYIQSMGPVVRNFSYNIGTNTFVGNDLTAISQHLFDGYEIVDWDYAPEPNKVVWTVRDDGTLLSLTYLREQEVSGWARHITDGAFRSVVQVQEGNESAVYFLVERYIRGRWVNYVERLASRQFGRDVSAAWFLDCAVQTPPTTFTSVATPTTTSGTITISTNAPTFSSADVGAWIKINDGIVNVNTFTSSGQVSGSTVLVLGSTYPASAGEWSIFHTASTFVGLSHLEGETVYALADGIPQGPFVVANATCTISSAAHFVTIGLPYESKLQTLYLDTGDPTIQSKRKNISAVSVRVVDTRGIQVGKDFSQMFGWKGQNGRAEDPVIQGQLPSLTTGDMRINIGSFMNVYGQTCIQQTYPWPASIIGFIPEINVGDDTK